MSDETRELHRIISASVRDMLDAYRIQAQAGPVTDHALEEIIFPGGLSRSCTVSRPIRNVHSPSSDHATDALGLYGNALERKENCMPAFRFRRRQPVVNKTAPPVARRSQVEGSGTAVNVTLAV